MTRRTKVLTASAAVLLLAIAGFAIHRSATEYERQRTRILKELAPVAPFDEAAERRWEQVLNEWKEAEDIPAQPLFRSLREIGEPLTVANFVDLCSYEMPPYSYIAPWKNVAARKRASIGVFMGFMGTGDTIYHSPGSGRALMEPWNGFAILVEMEADALTLRAFRDPGAKRD